MVKDQEVKCNLFKLTIDHILPLEQAAKAQRLLEERQTTGKVILTISP